MDRALMENLTEDQRDMVTRLKKTMAELVEEMISSFGFEEKEGVDHRAQIFAAVSQMEEGLATLPAELMEPFNAVFDQITMVYFEPDRVFGFLDEYRDSDGVLQLEDKNIGAFYGRSMAALSRVKADFERRMAELD